MLHFWGQCALLSAREMWHVSVLCLLQMHLLGVQEGAQRVEVFPFAMAMADEDSQLLKGSLMRQRASSSILES